MTGGNALLTRLKNVFDPTVVPVLTTQSVGRKLMPVNPKLSGMGLGVLTVDTMRYVARGDAITNYDIQKDIEDMVDVDSIQTRVPVQQDMVRIKYRDWLAFQRNGITLESDISTDMTSKIAREQDRIVAMGWKPQGTTYLIKGMYQVAGNTIAGADSGTYGNTKKAVSGAIGKLKEDGIYSQGYNLGLASFNFNEVSDIENTTGKSEFDAIVTSLNRDVPNGGKPGWIYEVPDLASGTGMVSPVASQANIRFFDIIELQVPENDIYFETNSITSDIMMSQTGAMVPRFKHLGINAAAGTDPCICTITALGTT